MRNALFKMKNILGGINSKLDTMKEKINELEDISTESIRPNEQEETEEA
jgi:hypothetical protein